MDRYKICQCREVKENWNLCDVEGALRACRDYNLGCRVLASVASIASPDSL